MPSCTPGVALLIELACKIAALRNWDKEKTILKMQDAVNVMRGFDAPAHSDLPKQPEYSETDQKLIQQAEDMLKGLDTPTPPFPPSDPPQQP